MDCFGQAVIEAILRKVVAIEKLMTESGHNVKSEMNNTAAPTSNSPDEHSTLEVSDLTSETDIAEASRCLLLSMKSKATETIFKQAVKQLMKTLNALTSNPNALSSRKLRKSTPAVAQSIIPYPELLDLLKRLGFVDEGSSFSIIKLDAELIQKTISVVEQFAVGVGL